MTDTVGTDLADAMLSRIFDDAHTCTAWRTDPVPSTVLRRLYDAVKMGPTSANCSPARFVFVSSQDGKEKLRSALSTSNAAQTMSAPVTAIVAQDMKFFDRLPELYPHADARPWFASSERVAEETAFRNSTLQGGYLILAARALGLGTGPMSGFKRDVLDAAFFAGSDLRSNFLVNLGWPAPEGYAARLPRLSFDDACTLI